MDEKLVNQWAGGLPRVECLRRSESSKRVSNPSDPSEGGSEAGTTPPESARVCRGGRGPDSGPSGNNLLWIFVANRFVNRFRSLESISNVPGEQI